MCNDDDDHRILGDLALRFSDKLGGIVELGSRLGNYTDDPDMLAHEGIYHYDGEDLLTSAAVRKWLSHRDFRMVK